MMVDKVPTEIHNMATINALCLETLPEFLEKILLDFGVNGKIKKVSHGPVVTLNEFEPAAGVKVSKIINLCDTFLVIKYGRSIVWHSRLFLRIARILKILSNTYIGY